MIQKIIASSFLLFMFSMPVKSENTRPWDEMTKLDKCIQRTNFPSIIYNVLKEGAIPNDSLVNNARVINNAIDKCSKAGGGKVLIPKGIFYTGGIRLKSNVNLVLAKGAVLRFSTSAQDYLPLVITRWEGIDCYNIQPLIYAYNESNIAITGSGVIDGQGSVATWWPLIGKDRYGWKSGMKSQLPAREALENMAKQNVAIEERIMQPEDGLRPQMINVYKCKRILVEGVTLINAPFWVIHPLMSQDVIVRHVKIRNHGPNGDGCDPESCDRVIIENCLFDTGDDCIAIKSGRNQDGRKWNIPSQNIIIRNCEMKDGHGAIVIGSEISGGFKNLYVENCTMDSPNLDRVLRIKSNICRGGVVENIFMRNITVGECKEAVVKVELNYFIDKEKCNDKFSPTVRNVYLENVTSQKSDFGINIDGILNGENVYDFTLKNCHFNGVKFGNLIVGAKEFTFNNYYINGNKCQ